MRRKLVFAFFMIFLIFPQILFAAAANNAAVVSTAAKPSQGTAKNMQQVSSKSASAELLNVRYAIHNDAVKGGSTLRLVIDSSGPIEASGTMINSPSPRLIVDVKGAALGKLKKSMVLDGTIAEKVSFLAVGSKNSRILIDLPTVINNNGYRVFTLKNDPGAKKTNRVVVDIEKPVPKPVFSFTPGLKGKTIAIDPGHGGSDPGAIGNNKTQEKNVTLAVAQKVQALLTQAGAQVIMTRDTDRDVFGLNASAVDELGARTLIANKRKADVFVSIHINAFTDPSVGGIASYYYPKTGYDMMLAQNIQDKLITVSGDFPDRGVSQAGFYVMKHADMPATLLELGFISNPREEKLLNTLQFQQEAARSIVDGLESFFAQAAAVTGGGR
ncbi:hypothetical protein P22_2377 [Propionispora sp. 2/2-37]|uniref:N-acetylmuramoyl-L-alanine amidase family protein n=1 Tax=Propionispora sp. 2/2-37 TaxID=1677858 RepID=UPI0006C12041|nr:N-acetylmuramoyl-L-alanine amidase [Propionispora sp. 2/2-37]CUH96287.1 hypothetical protein P22_2377 [Propionispora sp. 2/2-37]